MTDADLAERVAAVQDRAAESLSDDTVFQGIVRAGTLQQFVDTLTPLVAEGKIHVGDHGFRTTVVDPGNIAMYRPVTLAAEGFESVEAPGEMRALGVDFTTLDDRLGQANSDDLVSLSVDMESRKLVVHYRNIEHTVALIDPDAIRQEPDDPDLDLPNRIVIEGSDLSTAIKACDEVGDHVDLVADPDAEQVVIRSEGDTDTTDVTFAHGETIDAKVTEPATSILSLEYLKELSKPVPDGAEVEIRFGNEFPITLDWAACDGHLTAHAMQAPRIQSH